MRQPRRRGGRRLVLGLLIGCYALLAVAWVMGNPPGAAPDEGDHYVRALAVASGDVVGRPNPELVGQPKALPKKAGEPALAALWLKEGVRVVTVPAGLAPVGWGCNAFRSAVDASCLLGQPPPPAGPTEAPTTMGTVEPAMYVLPGLAARLGDRPDTALRLGRLADATVAVALLGVAAALLWTPSRSPLVLVGLLVAVTPMVVFVESSLSLSGPEIASGICFFAALLRLGRGRAGHPVWVAAGVSGVMLATSRSLGPVWILMMAAVTVGCYGWGPCRRAVRDGGAWAAVAIAAISLAALSTAVWEKAVQPGVNVDGAYFWKQVPPSFGDLPGVGRDLVGHFGWLDTGLPKAAYLLWASMVVVLLVAALVLGSGRQRAVLLLVPVGTVLLILLISAGLMRQNGFRVQGRHVLAFAVMGPMLAGEVLSANAGRLRTIRPGWLLLGFAVPAMGVHVAAWYTNARRSAVGATGPVWFVGLSKWSPPGSWTLWGLVVALAAAAGLAAAFLASGEEATAVAVATPSPAP
ncbi:MAG: DUF2142 domain-containing protein [Actinomycetota bacterium]|nr:DUF2142 domain-containing protein [Actinomycetota bacterium]